MAQNAGSLRQTDGDGPTADRARFGRGESAITWHTDPELGLATVVSMPLTPLAGAAQRAALVNLLIAGAALALLSVALPLTVSRITGNIRRVSAGAEAIAAGDLDQRIEVAGQDETSALAHAFNRMAASLAKTMGELRALTAELEGRVRRRTASLEAANEEIQTQNARLARERAVERVRAEALSMRSSQGMYGVVGEMYRQLRGLGVDTHGCTVGFIDWETETGLQYDAVASSAAGLDHLPGNAQAVQVDDDTVVALASGLPIEGLDRAMPGLVAGLRGGQVVTADRKLSAPASALAPDGAPDPADAIGTRSVTNVPFAHGFVGFNERERNDEHIEIVRELATALELGYPVSYTHLRAHET